MMEDTVLENLKPQINVINLRYRKQVVMLIFKEM